MVKWQPWTEKQDNLLKEAKEQGMTFSQIKKEHFPTRSESSISSRACIIGITHVNVWSNEELWICWIMNKKGFWTQEIADELGRTKKATSNKMSCKSLFYRPPPGEPPMELRREVDEILAMEDSK